MMTLRCFEAPPKNIPMATSWYLADLGEARGKQELFTKQSAEKLKALREHALIESAVSSNRIEGVEVDQSRVATLIFGRPAPRDRDEEEVRGYRDALKLIHESGAKLPITEDICPGVSVDLIRSVLKRLKGVSIECLGRGHTAKWRKTVK